MVAIAGCSEASGDEPSGDELAESTGTDIDAEVGESFMYEMKMTEANHYGLVQTVPPFQMEDSLERRNLKERYQYLNDRSNVHHVYLMSHDGKVVAYYTAQGKVSSVNSKLTNDRQIVKVPNAKWDRSNGAAGGNGVNYKVVESPQLDGSYGTNGDGIFFFTAGDGSYVEWNGLYVVSEEPKNIQTGVTLTDQVDDNESAS